MTTNPAAELLADSVRIYLQVRSAFDQCSPEVQEGVLDMMSIYEDSAATVDERQRALSTIVELLFPAHSDEFARQFNALRHAPDAQRYARRLEAQEKEFAENVKRYMSEQNLTQEALALKIGVGQSAISNMLNRQCRPQKRTIARIADALGVSADKLWPDDESIAG